ncbi:MAG: HAD family phosphatase [Flavobacteriaceae bacterium]|nr:HAD family phosphatase [Flavobacteriaceae bacterium]
MLKAVLFDMDGVIVDTEPLHRKAYFMMFAEMGLNVSEALYTSFTGQSTLEICETLVENFSMKQSPKDLVACKRKHFKQLFENDNSLTLLPGVLKLIENYYHNGLALVLASSASMDNINQIFTRFDLDRYFKAKLSGADLKKSKPHPEIFIKATQAADCSPNECMVIEDSTNGILAAKAAGIFCVGYNSLHSKDQDYSQADKVVGDFSELRFEVVKNWV